jgi:hypothetical protein
MMQPGAYLLIQESGGSNGMMLPMAEVTGNISMSATAGKVALTSSTMALSGTCPSGTVDLVGFGTGASCFEGSGAAPAPSTTTSLQRVGAGCVDTTSNAMDFMAATPVPRNSAATAVNCGCN